MNRYASIVFIFSILLVLCDSVVGQIDPSDPNLSPEERQRIIKEQEDVWNYHDSDKPGRSSASTLSRLAPAEQSYPFDPASDTVVTTNSGSRITIERGTLALPASFRRGSQVNVEIIEIIKHVDFLFAGIPMTYTDSSGHENLFESGGMFRLRFTYKDREVGFNRGRTLHIELAGNQASGPFHVYALGPDRKWKDKGLGETNLKPQCRLDSDSILRNSLRLPFSGGRISMTKQSGGTAAPGEDCGSIQFNIYSRIDGPGWWNFDTPKPEFTCLTGRLAGVNGDVSIMGVGLSYYGLSHAFGKGSYRINAMKDSDIKIIATFTRVQNGRIQEYALGSTIIIHTQNQTAHSTLPDGPGNRCQEIPPINIQQADPSLIRDRSAFLQRVGLADM